MTDETKAPEETRPPAPEPSTPEELEAYFERLDAFFKVLVEKTLEAGETLFTKDHLDALLFVNLIRGGLDSLRHYIESPEEPDITWENPWTELHFAVDWDWEAGGILNWKAGDLPEEKLAPITDALMRGEDPFKVAPDAVQEMAVTLLSKTFKEGTILQGLTHSLAVHVKDGEEAGCFFSPEDKATLDALTTSEEKAAFVASLREPFCIGGLDVEDEEGEVFHLVPVEHEEAEPGTLPPAIDAIEEKLRSIWKPSLAGEVNGVPVQCSPVMMIHPLVVDEDRREAYFPIVTGLVFAPGKQGGLVVQYTGGGTEESALEEMDQAFAAVNPSTWSAEDVADLWKNLLEDFPKKLLVEMGVPEEEASKEIREGKSTAPNPAAPVDLHEPVTVNVDTVVSVDRVPVTASTLALKPAGSPSPERRYLYDGSTRIDRGAALLQAHAGPLNLPRKWKDARRWEDLVQEEVDYYRENLGEEALVDLRRKTKNPNDRGRLLELRTSPDGKNVLTLTREAQEVLLARVGPRGFRRVLQDADGVKREYLVKRFPVRGAAGYMESRLSMYGNAWPLVEEGLEKAEADLVALRENLRLHRSLPFEDLDQRDRDEVDSRLRQLESIRDGREVMGAILHAFGALGENPLRVPAWTLRTLLECENDPHGFRRVRGCLHALQEFRFHLKVVGVPGVSQEISGPFLSTIRWVSGGVGAHTDGTFFLTLSEPFVGCLHVFQNTTSKVQDPLRVLSLDYGKKLSKEERAALKKGGYLKGFSALAPYFDRAKGFTEHQSNLRRWIEDNLTRKKDSTRRGGPHVKAHPAAADADEPRLFGRETCPLLPEGKLFHGALGHYRSGEQGRKLFGTPTAATKTGGAHPSGLLAEMGYTLPRGTASAKRGEIARKALQDMRAVVEEALGGLVAGRHGDRWLTLKDAEKLPVDTLLKSVVWYLFLDQEWRETLGKAIEAYHEKRHARGDTPYLVKVSQDRKLVDKAETSRGLPEGAVGLDGEPLHLRLYIARNERKLSQAAVGALFGVSQALVNYWERGTEPDEDGRVKGKPIPPDVAPLVLRWVEGGTPPTEEELAALAVRRKVRPGTRKEPPV